jgi:Phage tail assembly chaperone protein
MKHTIFSYLSDNYAGQYYFNGVPYAYDNLVWVGSSSKPTLAQLITIVDQLNKDEPYRLLRLKRDRLLAESDMYGLDDYPFVNDLHKKTWRDYRQELRNLTDACTPQLTDNGDLDESSVPWPIKPFPIKR